MLLRLIVVVLVIYKSAWNKKKVEEEEEDDANLLWQPEGKEDQLSKCPQCSLSSAFHWETEKRWRTATDRRTNSRDQRDETSFFLLLLPVRNPTGHPSYGIFSPPPLPCHISANSSERNVAVANRFLLDEQSVPLLLQLHSSRSPADRAKELDRWMNRV